MAMIRATLLISIFAMAGCGQLVTAAMVYAPNRGDDVAEKASSPSALRRQGVAQELRVDVGPPAASIRLQVLDPTGCEEPQGTVLVMHGYRASVTWIRGTGEALAEAGYRVVLMDMRGHGYSSGDYITYGVHESRDAVQVIDHLEEEGLIVGKLGVWGISMGGATAIQLAARDKRVDTVVAVAPYTSMREVVPGVVRMLLPIWGWFASDETIRERVDAAGELAGFSPDEADTLAAMVNVQAPTLIIHGTGDWVVPLEHGRRLHEVNPEHSQLLELDWTAHISAHFSNKVRRESVKWFDWHLSFLHEGHEEMKGTK